MLCVYNINRLKKAEIQINNCNVTTYDQLQQSTASHNESVLVTTRCQSSYFSADPIHIESYSLHSHLYYLFLFRTHLMLSSIYYRILNMNLAHITTGCCYFDSFNLFVGLAQYYNAKEYATKSWPFYNNIFTLYSVLKPESGLLFGHAGQFHQWLKRYYLVAGIPLSTADVPPSYHNMTFSCWFTKQMDFLDTRESKEITKHINTFSNLP